MLLNPDNHSLIVINVLVKFQIMPFTCSRVKIIVFCQRKGVRIYYILFKDCVFRNSNIEPLQLVYGAAYVLCFNLLFDDVSFRIIGINTFTESLEFTVSDIEMPFSMSKDIAFTVCIIRLVPLVGPLSGCGT